MNRTRGILLAGLALIVISGAWLWLGKPSQVDMTIYAPADSLLYFEANRPADVVDAISATDAWKRLGALTGPLASTSNRPWLRGLIARTGLGPAKSVVLARAQVAAVLIDLRTVEQGDTLNVKPEGVLLIETHTSSSRVRPVFEDALKTLAEKTFTEPTLRRTTVDGVEFLEWVAPQESRQIVGALVGSLVVIGTSEDALRKCLAAARGSVSSLRDDLEMQRVRTSVQSSAPLTFGFVPQASSAKLLALGLPAMLGHAPGDAQFQRLIAGGAAKIFGSLAWTSRSYQGGIEDRYLISLQAPVGPRLKGPFQSVSPTYDPSSVIPNNVYSMTSYNIANPLDAWRALNGTVSAQVDALSTVVFTSLLKSSLISYGISDPESFLGAVDTTLLTIRLDEFDERSILVAGVGNRAALRALIQKSMTAKPNAAGETNEAFEDSTGELGARLGNDFVVLGSPEDVRRYAERGAALDNVALKRLTFFRSSSGDATVVTYTHDADRVRSFFASILSAKGLQATATPESEQSLASLPYAVTETTLTEQRIERVTRSPLGQFSSLFPLLIPAPPSRPAKFQTK
jgi:hypothetical protein